MEKCNWCPLLGLADVECWAAKRDLPLYCERVNKLCEFRRAVVELSTRQPSGIECPEDVVEVRVAEPVSLPVPIPTPVPHPKPSNRIAIPWDWLTDDQRTKYESFKGCGCGGRRVPVEIQDVNPDQRKRLPGIYSKAQLEQFGL